VGVGGATTCCGGGRYIRRDRSGPCIDLVAVSFPLRCVAYWKPLLHNLKEKRDGY